MIAILLFNHFIKIFIIKKSLANCEFVHKNGFYFRIHPEMTNKQVNLLKKLFS